jgi:hypothetical protein
MNILNLRWIFLEEEGGLKFVHYYGPKRFKKSNPSIPIVNKISRYNLGFTARNSNGSIYILYLIMVQTKILWRFQTKFDFYIAFILLLGNWSIWLIHCFSILISVSKFENRACWSTFEMEIRHLGNHHGHAEQPRTTDLNLPGLFSCM